MKIRGIASILFLSLLLINCSGSGGGSSSGTVTATTTPATATATEASVFGTADKISVAIAKPDQNMEKVKAAASPLAGAAVTAIKSDGTSAGSATTALDGTYTLLVPINGTYVIKITSGNIVMKAVYAVNTGNFTVNVGPGTTAAVIILEKKLNTTFDSGTAFSTAVGGVDVNASVTAIAATSGFTTTASAVVNAVAADTNPLTTTTVTSAASTAATSVSVASLVGTWVGTSTNAATGAYSAVTFVFTATTATIGAGSSCELSGPYTTNGSYLSVTITSQNPAGCKSDTHLTGTYGISGNTLTLSITSYSGGTFIGTNSAITPAATSNDAALAGIWVGKFSDKPSETLTFTFSSNTMILGNTGTTCVTTFSYTASAGSMAWTVAGYNGAACNNNSGSIGTVLTFTYSITGTGTGAALTMSTTTGTAATFTGTKQ